MKINAQNLLAGSGLLVLASIASAQTPPIASSDQLDEIVVTARRSEEKLQDVPISMTVFNQEQLDKANIVNATDLASITPSLSANNNFGNENASFALRGFVQDTGTQPSVGVFFADVIAPRGANNGVQVGDGAGPGTFFDLENVQILKGPQGTLFGRNTTGGAILFVPKKPSANFGGYAEISTGNYDMKRGQGAINFPFSDTVRFRLAVDRQQRDGYITNNILAASNNNASLSANTQDDFNDVNYLAARASLVIDVTPELENYTIASYTKSNTHGSVQKVIACNTGSPLGSQAACAQVQKNAARGDDFYTLQSTIKNPHSILEQKQAINTTTWRMTSDFTLKNIISYATLTDDLRTSQFGTYWPAVNSRLIFAYVQPPPDGTKTANQSTFTDELQAHASFLDGRLEYQGGVYFESSRPLSKSGNQSPFLIVCSNPDAVQCNDLLGFSAGTGDPVGAINYTVGETDYRDIGVYSQANYDLTDKVKLTGGYRYTWDRQRNTSTLISYRSSDLNDLTAPLIPTCTDPASDTNPALGNQGAGCSVSLQSTSSAPTWLIETSYKPISDMMLYANYKRGYRAGGVLIGAPLDKRSFKPEKVDTYEMGLKSSFRGAVHGTFNMAAFYNDFTNQQLQLPFVSALHSGQSPTTGIVNAGKSKIYGAEVELSITPVRDLVFGVNYTYLRTKIVKIDSDAFQSTDSAFISSAPVKVGDPEVLSPQNKVTVSGKYTLPFSDSVGKVALGATYVHTDRQLSNYNYIDDPSIIPLLGGNWGTLKERNLLNANVDWDSIFKLPIDVSLFASNLTNQHYYAFVAGLSGAGFETATLGEPRMYGAKLRYRFGN